MKYSQQDVKRVSRTSKIVKGQAERYWTDVLQHVPTGIVCTGQGNYADSYYNALGLLEKTVNAYYEALPPQVTDEMCAALQLESPVNGCSTGECGCPYRVSLDTRKRMGEAEPLDMLQRDVALFGVAYSIDGKRVDPALVRLYGGVDARIIAFDEAPTLADMIDKGWLNDYYGKMGSRYPVDERINDLLAFEAECWLNEQPDHTSISKSPCVPSDLTVWAFIERNTIARSSTGKQCVDFDALRRDICKQCNVDAY